MEFVAKDVAKNVSGLPSAGSGVVAGQTWTKQLCNDPSCNIDHSNEGWNVEGGPDGSKETDSEAFVAPIDRIVTPLDWLSAAFDQSMASNHTSDTSTTAAAGGGGGGGSGSGSGGDKEGGEKEEAWRPKEGEKFIYIVGTRGVKVTRISNELDYLAPSLESLTLRSNLLSSMQGVENLVQLTHLELYDNQIESLSHLDQLSKLTILDMSFNAIREMSPVACCPLLTELYIAQNKLRKIEGISEMKHLKILDLGANRIRSMSNCGLDKLINLESLWLGKNKIEAIDGVNALPKLEKLDVQHNRLLSIDNAIVHNDVESKEGDEGVDAALQGITGLKSLRQLYLASNSITNVKGLPLESKLECIDLTSNKISNLDGIEVHKELGDLWLTSNEIENMAQIQALTVLPELASLYLEHCPISKALTYKEDVKALLPNLMELDGRSL